MQTECMHALKELALLCAGRYEKGEIAQVGSRRRLQQQSFLRTLTS